MCDAFNRDLDILANFMAVLAKWTSRGKLFQNLFDLQNFFYLCKCCKNSGHPMVINFLGLKCQ